jgi:NAD(P)-dependent dehydrogenase (short-subunit alcohol dehydrogenase family)
MPKAMAEKRFRGKTAIVTGGNSGIGKAAALRFAIEGANVAIIGRDAITGEATVAEIKAAGGHASFHMADVGKNSEVESAMRAILSTYDQVDMAFNNAGVSGSISEFDAVADQEFASVFQTNLFGIYHSMKLQIRHFLDRNIRGCIVNCASISGLVGVPYQSAYCASKHAVVGLTKSVALEYAEQGIRINAVCPGGVATPMLKKYLRLLTPEKRTALEPPPIGRMANSNEIANMVAWLCSDEASYVIGQSYAVDGGFTVR